MLKFPVALAVAFSGHTVVIRVLLVTYACVAWRPRAAKLCQPGDSVLALRPAFRAGSGGGSREWVSAQVLERDQEELRAVLQWYDGREPPRSSELLTWVRTHTGRPCMRAALCFFGRVGNTWSSYSGNGSTREALDLSAPTVWEHVILANSAEFEFDIMAHTWDVELGQDIRSVYRLKDLDAREQPEWTFEKSGHNVHSFGEATRRAAALKARVEAREGFVYDLVVLMRYDIEWRSPMELSRMIAGNLTDSLWTGFWCSVHAQDLKVRNVVLVPPEEPEGRLSRHSGVFAASQWNTVALHDYWFVGSSANIDRFAQWGERINDMYEKEVRPVASWTVFHSGHFYTYLYARSIGLWIKRSAVSYVDYTLLRWRHCRILAGDYVTPPDIMCHKWTYGRAACNSGPWKPRLRSLLTMVK